jgi:hypothetical protein
MHWSPYKPKLGDRFEIAGTVWAGDIISLWADKGDLQVLVEWDADALQNGWGGDGKRRKMFMLSDLTLNLERDVWVEKAKVRS